METSTLFSWTVVYPILGRFYSVFFYTPCKTSETSDVFSGCRKENFAWNVLASSVNKKTYLKYVIEDYIGPENGLKSTISKVDNFNKIGFSKWSIFLSSAQDNWISNLIEESDRFLQQFMSNSIEANSNKCNLRLTLNTQV